MSFRFRQTFSLLPGLHLNVGKAGVSLSLGVPGVSLNLGPRGSSLALGIPGTGLSYRHPLSIPAQKQPTVLLMNSQYPLATGPTGTELRAILLPDARRTLNDDRVREAWELFVKTAENLQGVGSIFEMMLRPEVRGNVVNGERANAFMPRQINIFANPEPALGPGGHSVVMTGGMFWEFLPGRFFANGHTYDGLQVAMDVGGFQTIEITPSGDAEVVGYSGRQPIMKYVRVDVSCGSLRTSVAFSNIALAGHFVAAYRNYIEVLAGRPYKEVHPYRDLNAAPIQRLPAPLSRQVDTVAYPEPSRKSARPLKAIMGILGLFVALGAIGHIANQSSKPTALSNATPTSSASGQQAGTLSNRATIQSSPSQLAVSSAGRDGRTKQGANIRSGPSGDAPVIRTVAGGTPLRIVETVNNWHRISLGGEGPIGWIHRSLVD